MEKDEIRQIVIDQQHEFTQTQQKALAREQLPALKDLLTSSRLVKVVLGIRRSGKSTLCTQALRDKKALYLNFDDERLAGFDSEDLQRLLEVFKEMDPEANVYFFDEIQNIASWELFVNRLHRTGHNLLISGSNGKLLSKELATHLTGREVSLTLFPLSFSEFLAWRGIKLAPGELQGLTSSRRAQLSGSFEDYFQRGGFPEVVLGEQPNIYLRELFDKIISRDIVQRHKIRDVRVIKEIASYLIQNSSQFISCQNIKTTFRLKSIVTTRKYVQLLQDVFLIHQIKGYSFKLKERSTSRRKTYSCDVGLIRALWTKPTLDLGAQLETLVLLHLIKQGQEVYYLFEDAREVDFCTIEDGKPSQLIQVCYDLSSPKTKERELRALVDLGKKYEAEDLFIVTRDLTENIVHDGKRIQIVPAWEFLLRT